MSIVAGALGVLGGAVLIAVVLTHRVGAIFWVPALYLLVLSVPALAGGIAGVRRKSWGLALFGAVVSFVIMPVLGIPAVVLTSLAREEFAAPMSWWDVGKTVLSLAVLLFGALLAAGLAYLCSLCTLAAFGIQLESDPLTRWLDKVHPAPLALLALLALGLTALTLHFLEPVARRLGKGAEG